MKFVITLIKVKRDTNELLDKRTCVCNELQLKSELSDVSIWGFQYNLISNLNVEDPKVIELDTSTVAIKAYLFITKIKD